VASHLRERIKKRKRKRRGLPEKEQQNTASADALTHTTHTFVGSKSGASTEVGRKKRKGCRRERGRDRFSGLLLLVLGLLLLELLLLGLLLLWLLVLPTRLLLLLRCHEWGGGLMLLLLVAGRRERPPAGAGGDEGDETAGRPGWPLLKRLLEAKPPLLEAPSPTATSL
jgi:hypothetical protein